MPATLGGFGLGFPEPGRKGSREICSVRHFQAGCECTARKDIALHALRLCARARGRPTLVLGMFLIIANVLATSYCNLAAPLVCLALLGHVELIIFQGAMSR